MNSQTKAPSNPRSRIAGLLVILLMLAGVALVLTPFNRGRLGNAETVRSLNNARGIKSALDLFASDFDGIYPNEETARELIWLSELHNHPTPKKSTSSPSTSNYYFNQLIGRGLDNEEIFFDFSLKKTFQLRRPNNDGIVDEGENVWGYTKNLKQTSKSRLPLIFSTPLDLGENPSFPKNHGNGRIVVARLDGSIYTEIIGGTGPEVGHVTGKVDGDHINLFSQEALEEGTMVPADLKRLASSK